MTSPKSETREKATTEQQALSCIKDLVCGEGNVRWKDSWATTNTRMRIADICDAALGNLSHASPSAPAPFFGGRTVEASPAPDGTWHKGVPPHPFDKEWFIAQTTYGDRVVLMALPEEFSYDFKTADETYWKKDKIKCWMQFPDSSYIPFCSPVIHEPTAASPAPDEVEKELKECENLILAGYVLGKKEQVWLVRELRAAQARLAEFSAKNIAHVAALELAEQERDAARKIVERLPKTADGVPVIPCVDSVYYKAANGVHQLSVDDDESASFGGDWMQKILTCYSTSEAALAAKPREEGKAKS